MQLLSLGLDLFKLVIKANNEFRKLKKKGLTYKRINHIIQAYCEFNGLGKDILEQLKLEIFDITMLTCADFKEIFYDFFCKSLEQKSLSSMSTIDESTLSSAKTSPKKDKLVRFGVFLVEQNSL